MVRLVLAVLAALVFAAPAAAQNPLAGEGENMEILANVPIGGGVTEMELAGDYAYVVYDEGLAIVDVSKPAAPEVVGRWECAAGWGDVELDPEATFAIVANAYGGSCSDLGSSLVILDISDKRNPKAVSGLEPQGGLRAHTITLDGRTMYVNTGVWGGNPSTSPSIQVFDLADLSEPKLLSEIALENPTSPHDAYVDHRPDGRALFYSASGHDHYVIDVTDPKAPVYLQTAYTPQIEYAHQDEPNHDRSMIVASDESLVGLFGSVCGGAVGAIYFYAAGSDGLWSGGGSEPLGYWGLPPSAGSGCSAHVYWQAPDQNRLTMGMYTAGITVLDYTDPLGVRQLGWFKPEGNPSVWGSKPHNGHVYASGERGLDILRYTGEDGKGWPATAGAAEVQRAARMGLKLAPLAPPPVVAPASPAAAARRLGRFRAVARLRRVRARRLTFTATDATGARVASVRFRRRARVRITGVAEAGTYRWRIRAGRRVVARGRTVVRESAGLVLAPGRRLEVLAR